MYFIPCPLRVTNVLENSRAHLNRSTLSTELRMVRVCSLSSSTSIKSIA